MPRIQLTDVTIRALTATKPTDYWDAKLPSFGVRVCVHAKTFMVKLGNSRRSIGSYPALSLKGARAKAMAMKSERRDTAPKTSLANLRELFLSVHCADYRPRTLYETKRLLKKTDTLARKRIADITTDHLMAIVDAQTPAEANHLFKVLRTLFRFAARRRLIQVSPLNLLSMPRKAPPRARILTDDELRSVWTAAEKTGGHFGAIVKLLILTGQRRGEIAALHASWIKNDTIEFPDSVTKNKREHTIPIGAFTTTLISQVSSPALLFPARGKRSQPFNGWSKAKAALDRRLGGTVAPWTLHDLRRTFATRMAELGVQPHVIERILNHSVGALSPISLVYNRASYLKEMREAIELYQDHLQKLFDTSKVG